MAKFIDDAVMDVALDYVATSDRNCVCSAQPLQHYEAIDPNQWIALTVYALNNLVKPLIRNGFVYDATTGGTSSASEPVWPTIVGNTVADGTVIWTCRNNYSLAQGGLSGADFTKSNGDVSGRKVTVAAKTGLSIHTTGTATHVALLDNTTLKLIDVTITTSQGLTSGGTVDTGAWDHEIGDVA